jgi:type II secretory pathway component PulF
MMIRYGPLAAETASFPLTRDEKREISKQVKRGRKREDVERDLAARNDRKTRGALKLMAFGETYGTRPEVVRDAAHLTREEWERIGASFERQWPYMRGR